MCRLIHRAKQVGQNTISVHLWISIGQPAFAKDTSVSVLVAYTLRRFIKTIRILWISRSSQSITQQNGTKIIQAIVHAITSLYHIASTKASGCSSNIFEIRALFMCLVHGVLVAANKMSYGSLLIFPGCFQDVMTLDPIQAKDMMPLIFRHVDMLGSFNVANPKLEKTRAKDWKVKKESQNELTDQWRWKKLRTSQDNMQSWNTLKKNKKDYQQINTYKQDTQRGTTKWKREQEREKK